MSCSLRHSVYFFINVAFGLLQNKNPWTFRY